MVDQTVGLGGRRYTSRPIAVSLFATSLTHAHQRPVGGCYGALSFGDTRSRWRIDFDFDSRDRVRKRAQQCDDFTINVFKLLAMVVTA